MPTKAQARRSKKNGPKYEARRSKAAASRERKLNRYISTVEQHGVPEPRDENTLRRREAKLRERITRLKAADEPNPKAIGTARAELGKFLETNEGVDKSVKNPEGLQNAKAKLDSVKRTGRTK